MVIVFTTRVGGSVSCYGPLTMRSDSSYQLKFNQNHSVSNRSEELENVEGVLFPVPLELHFESEVGIAV